MFSLTNKAKSFRLFIGIMGIAFLMSIFATPTFAGKDCGFFKVTIGGKTYTAAGGDIRLILPAADVNGKTAIVKGTFAEFKVDLDTFTVIDYVLTGAPSSRDITGGRRTRVFVSQTPQLANDLTGNLELRLSQENVRLVRAGRGAKMKVDAKDCNQGDIFELQSNFPIRVAHVLDPAFHYFTDRLGRTMFTNGKVIGREHPELAKLISRTSRTSQWQVNAGGDVEAVFGEDALEQ